MPPDPATDGRWRWSLIVLAGLVPFAADHPERCREMGAAGYQFISAKLDQSHILDRYADVLEALAQGRGGTVPTWDPFE